MFHAMNSVIGDAALQRLTLLVNHVLASEPVATQKLRTHEGRCVEFHFNGWPSMLPPLPRTAFRVTPAGLMESCGVDAPVEPDLKVSVDASNPALAMLQAVTGTRPKVEISGDAAFAADLNWLIDNLRWDLQDDLAGVVGQAPAHEIARVAGIVANGLREALRAFGNIATRTRDVPAEPPAR
jgi:ubiquinone biosynthesis protein UbiJ